MSRRWVRIGKWGGLGALSLLAAAWVASGWRFVAWTWSDGARQGFINCNCGVCQAGFGSLPSKPSRPSRLWGRVTSFRRSDLKWPVPEWGWRVGYRPAGPASIATVEAPIWAAFAVVAAATAVLWRHDRRRPPGVCPRCSYDLTGAPSATCPECGAATHTTPPPPGPLPPERARQGVA